MRARVGVAAIVLSCVGSTVVTSCSRAGDGGALLPTTVVDAGGDNGSGPPYGDCITAGMAGNGGASMIAVQKINGTFPPEPIGDIDCWSWRFDTDLNTNTGFRQYDYIGIDWEILIQPGASGWTVNKWSPSGGTVNLPNARLIVQPHEDGDVIVVRFDAAEIGAPPHLNWIAWNGRGSTWADVAPDGNVAWWER